MIHSQMVDPNEASSSIVHALQSKHRNKQRLQREKESLPTQVLVRKGPNFFELRDKTPEEISADIAAAAKAEAEKKGLGEAAAAAAADAAVKKAEEDAKKGFGWTGALAGNDEPAPATEGGGAPIGDSFQFDSAGYEQLQKRSKEVRQWRSKVYSATIRKNEAFHLRDRLKQQYLKASTHAASSTPAAFQALKVAKEEDAALLQQLLKKDMAPTAARQEVKKQRDLKDQVNRTRVRQRALEQLAAAKKRADESSPRRDSFSDLPQALQEYARACAAAFTARQSLTRANQALETARRRERVFRGRLLTAQKLRSRQRLQRDLVEVMRNRREMPSIAAHPMEGDIYEWHANILGSAPYYEGVVLHCILRFPKNYPHTAPRVELCTPIDHKNVFGSWICLDMLESDWWPDNWRDSTSDQYTGWSSGYTVMSVLMQLQSWLMDGARKPYGAGSLFQHRHRTILRIARFQCAACGHTHARPSPPFPRGTVTRTSSLTDPRFAYYEEKASRRIDEAGQEVVVSIKYIRKWLKTNLWTLREGTQANRQQQNVVQVERVLASLMRDNLEAKASALTRLAGKADCSDSHTMKRAAKLRTKARLVTKTLAEWSAKGPAGPKEFVSTVFRRTLDTWSEETEVTAEAWAAAAAEAGNNSCSDHNSDEDEGSDKQEAPSSQQRHRAPRQSQQPAKSSTRGKLDVEVTVRSMAVAAASSASQQSAHQVVVDAVDVRITHCSSNAVTGIVVGGLYDGASAEVDSVDLFEVVVRGGDCVVVPRHNMTVGSTHHLFVSRIDDRNRRGVVVHCAVKKPTATRRNKRSDGSNNNNNNNNNKARARNLSNFQVGDRVQGVVTRHTHFGAFVRVTGWPRDGLVHASAVQRGVRHGDFATLLPVGPDEVVCWVHSVDRKQKKLGLGLFPPKGSVEEVGKAAGSAEAGAAAAAAAAPPPPPPAGNGATTKPTKNDVSHEPIVGSMDDLVEAQKSGRVLEGRIAKYVNSQQDAIIEIGRSSSSSSSVRITASTNMLRTYAAPRGRFVWDITTVLPVGALIDVRVVEANASRKRCIVAPASARIFFEESDAANKADSAAAAAANSSTAAGNEGTVGLNFFQRIPHRVLTMVWSFLGQSYSSWRGQPQLRRKDPANGKWHTFKQFVATYGPRQGGIEWQKAWDRSPLTKANVTSGVDDPVPDGAGYVRDCVALASTCKFLLHSCPRAAEHHDANTICCFHTRKNHTQATLGFGLNLEFYPRAAGDKSPARLAYVHTTSDIISYDAYEAHGLRRNLWKAPFTHWFPAFIDDVHWHRGGRVAANAMLAKIFGVDVATVDKTPELVLELVPKVLNTMVLSIMKGVSHASIAALHAYCQWAHVLTGFCQEYPGVQAAIDTKIRGFVSSEFGRNKYNCPALGEFLPLLLFTNKYSWADVAADYLSETFDRNSKWILARHPELNDTCAELARRTRTPEGGTLSHGTSMARIGKSFACSQTSMRLLCFHVALLRSFDFIRRGSREVDAQSQARFQCHGSPSSSAATGSLLLPTSRLKAYFDRTNGRTTPELETALQKEIFKIQEIGKLPGVRWAEVFAYLRLPCPSDAFLSSWLRCSMRNSGRRRYHQRDAMKDMLEEEADRERRSRERLKERMQKLDDGFDETDQYYDAVADTRSSRGW